MLSIHSDMLSEFKSVGSVYGPQESSQMEDMCFSLLKFKMRIDKKLNPWLLKVKPLLAKDLKKEDSIHHQVIQDTLKLIYMT